MLSDLGSSFEVANASPRQPPGPDNNYRSDSALLLVDLHNYLIRPLTVASRAAGAAAP
jgi:hypothetical protein